MLFPCLIAPTFVEDVARRQVYSPGAVTPAGRQHVEIASVNYYVGIFRQVTLRTAPGSNDVERLPVIGPLELNSYRRSI